jgi:aarF domain-containing kinase
MLLSFVKRLKPIAIGGVVGYGVYNWDKHFQSEVLQRSVRALACGIAIAAEYKFVWTPHNASEVNERVARRIVDCCKRNEGLYVKFGQVLGSMQVAFPPEFQKPFAELLDQANTFDTSIIHDIVAKSLSPEDAKLLTDISVFPVASASVAQVHTAQYGDRKVALKVQKPNIEVQTGYDLAVFWIILASLEYLFDIPMVWSFDYVKQQLESELDFRVEASNARLCREELARNRHLRHITYVPDTYCATRKVIIAEWIDDAVKITDTAALQSLGVDSRQVVSDATRLFAYQIFGTGDVHCDPHPGNLLVRVKPSSRRGHAFSLLDSLSSVWGWGGAGVRQHEVVLIDHGLYTHLSPSLRQEYTQFWMAMINSDVSEMQRICGGWGIRDSQLFSNMTRMQANRNPSDTRSTTGSRKPYSELDPEEKRAREVEMAERHARMKERMRLMLADTSRFPDELMFVNRCVNYIRATNWAHGSPIDRVGIFAETATAAAQGDFGRENEQSWSSQYAIVMLKAKVLYKVAKHSFERRFSSLPLKKN